MLHARVDIRASQRWYKSTVILHWGKKGWPLFSLSVSATGRAAQHTNSLTPPAAVLPYQESVTSNRGESSHSELRALGLILSILVHTQRLSGWLSWAYSELLRVQEETAYLSRNPLGSPLLICWLELVCSSFEEKGAPSSAQSSPVRPAQGEFKAGLERMCDVLRVANRLAGWPQQEALIHCLPGWNNRLELSPELTCDLGWHVISPEVRKKRGAWWIYKGKEGKRGKWNAHVCKNSIPGPFLLRAGFLDVVLLFLNAQANLIVRLGGPEECQVFSKSISSQACHEISAGYQVRVQSSLCKQFIQVTF